ncbi:MAG: glycosyltransferase family 39 protein [Aquihabitans sp.]
MSIPAAEPVGRVESDDKLPTALVVAVGLVVVVGLILRFVVDSPLWLDEALSVNIARLPLGEIPAALKQDGHPPLYYLFLHGWMLLFGEGNVAVRAFSGLWAVALLPLMWVAGRRLGGRRGAVLALAVLALSPYAIRYATETRMYAMVSVLVLAGWLVVTDALEEATWPRLAGISVLTGMLLWTHYWSLWLLTVVGTALLVHRWRAARSGDRSATAATTRVIGAIIVGGLTFVPWLPTLLYQGAHTGTPWARPVRPTEMVIFTITDFGGGPYPEATLLGVCLIVVVLLGIFGAADGPTRVILDLRTRAQARPLLILVAGTLAVACVAGYATGATYATRYAAVFFPFVVLLAALGLLQLEGRVASYATLAVLLLLGVAGVAQGAMKERSDSVRSATAITSRAEPGDVVVFCPDQLGPAGSRVLGPGLDQVTYPEFLPPERVDWVDYDQRLSEADPGRFADDLIERAGDHRIFLVYSTDYKSHEEICPTLRNAISTHRTPEELTRPTEASEPSSVVVWEPTST